jgi:hypothetical protein
MLQTLQSNVIQGTWRPYSNSNTIGLAGYLLKIVNAHTNNASLASGTPGVDLPAAVTDIVTDVLVDDGANPLATTNQAMQVTALPLQSVSQFRAIANGTGNVGDKLVLAYGSGNWGQVIGLGTTPTAVITSASNASPNVFTTAAAHGLNPGDTVVITGATGDTTMNGTFIVNTVPTSTTFTLNKLSGAALNTGGTYTASSATFTRQNIYQVLGFALENYVAGQLVLIKRHGFSITA